MKIFVLVFVVTNVVTTNTNSYFRIYKKQKDGEQI